MTHPLSVFVLYSPSRRPQFEQFARLLARCDRYDECQKILVADNETDIRPPDYDTIVVPRASKHFCWSDAWDAAMKTVRAEKVLYLDCDRILPKWYLTQLIDTLKDYEFVYPSCLWNLKIDVPDEHLIDPSKLDPDDYWVEYPTANNRAFPCRGPMSGTSAFTVASYNYIGPLDRNYVSWGYPDLEYQEAIKAKGSIFRPIDVPVLHLKHNYEIDYQIFLKVNAWNGVRFFKKWKLPYTPAFIESLNKLQLTPEDLFKLTMDDLLP